MPRHTSAVPIRVSKPRTKAAEPVVEAVAAEPEPVVKAVRTESPARLRKLLMRRPRW